VTVHSLRPRLAGALFGLLAGAAFAVPPVTEVALLDMTPRPNQQQRQTVDMQAVMNVRIEPRADASDAERARAEQARSMMPMTMKSRMEQTLQTGAQRKDGWIPLSLNQRMLDFTLTAGNGATLPVPPANMANLKFSARFNPKDFAFDIEEVQGDAEEQFRTLSATTLTKFLAIAKALHEHKIKVGESFELPMDMPLQMPVPSASGGQMKGMLRYTLNRVDKGIAYFDVATDLDINASMVPPAGAASSVPTGPMDMQAKGGGKGQFTLRLADRLALSSDMGMQMHMTVNSPNGDVMFMDMDMQMKGRGESLKATAKR